MSIKNSAKANGPTKVCNFISKVLHVIHYCCISMVWPLVQVGLQGQNTSLSIRDPFGTIQERSLFHAITSSEQLFNSGEVGQNFAICWETQLL